MADNVAITAGAGTTIATDDIGGVQHQRIKLTMGADGVSEGDVSSANPMPVIGKGELIEALEAIRMALGSLNRTSGQVMPDPQGRMRVALDTITAGLTLATITTVGTVTTVTTVTTVASVTNQAQMGGFAAQDQVPALMHISADSLRRNISVT
jgi:hypothetical protein